MTQLFTTAEQLKHTCVVTGIVTTTTAAVNELRLHAKLIYFIRKSDTIFFLLRVTCMTGNKIYHIPVLILWDIDLCSFLRQLVMLCGEPFVSIVRYGDLCTVYIVTQLQELQY